MPKTFDERFQVNTEKPLEKDAFDSALTNRESACMYKPTPANEFARMMEHIPSSVKKGRLIDFGCGKGRVLILAYETGFKKVTGVEFEPSLCQQTRENLQSIGLSEVEVIEKDAVDYRIPEDATLFYFFNPFGIHILEKVLLNIVDSLSQHPREAYVIYAMPAHPEAFYPDRFIPVARNAEGVSEYAVFAIKTDEMTQFEKALVRLEEIKKGL